MASNQNEDEGDGHHFHHILSERAYLIDNILAFVRKHPEVAPHDITVYELREVNERFKLSTIEEVEGI